MIMVSAIGPGAHMTVIFDLTWILPLNRGGISKDSSLLIEHLAAASQSPCAAIVRRWVGPKSLPTPHMDFDLSDWLFQSSSRGLSRLPDWVTKRMDASHQTGRFGKSNLETLGVSVSSAQRPVVEAIDSLRPVWPPQDRVISGWTSGKSPRLAHNAGPVLFADVVAPTSSCGIRRLHDAIPGLHPALVTPLSSRVHTSALAYSEPHWNLAVSQTAVDQARALLGSEFRNTKVVPNIIEYDTSTGTDADLIEISGYCSDPRDVNALRLALLDPECAIVLSVAPFEPKKDMTTFLKAVISCAAQNTGKKWLTVSVSGDGWGNNPRRGLVEAARGTGRYIRVQGLPDKLLQHLYSRADLYVSTSVIEGFGRPPAEALNAGCAVAVTDIQAHREVLDNSAEFFDVGDVSWLARRMSECLLISDSERRERKADADIRLNKFRPEVVVEAFNSSVDGWTR